MVEINETNLVFAFPDVDEEAILRVHFCLTDAPGLRMRIEAAPGRPMRLAAVGPFVMYLQPNDSRRWLRYPFALLVSVGGKNAITGVPAATLERSPQNYFSSPPQGGIDGFYRNGRVLTFRAGDEAALNQTRLEVKVFPMKRNAMDYFRFRTGQAVISGREPSALFTLVHGGERQCEPIYEDMCNIGCWDQEHEEQVALWVGA